MRNAAPLRPCAGNCGRVVLRGCCPACAGRRAVQDGALLPNPYGYTWVRWRPRYIAMLLAAGIPPVCGATMPGGPQTGHSLCKAAGLMTGASANGSSLHLNHEPPLTDAERGDHAAVCDPWRIELLCASCHDRLSPTRWGRRPVAYV